MLLTLILALLTGSLTYAVVRHKGGLVRTILAYLFGFFSGLAVSVLCATAYEGVLHQKIIGSGAIGSLIGPAVALFLAAKRRRDAPGLVGRPSSTIAENAAGLIRLLTTVRGRIGRASWWTGAAVIIAADVIGAFLIDPGYLTAWPPRAPTTLLALWNLVLVAPATAIMVKRFNDRDWPNWLGYAVGTMEVVYIAARHYGFTMDQYELVTHPVAAPTHQQLAFLLFGAVSMFALIDNGFVKGTPGLNRYGPDPLT